MGLAALRHHDAKACIERMNDLLAFKDLPPESRWKSFAYLRRGEAYAMQGQREKARADYQRVLQRPDVWESHQEASALIRRG